MIASAPDCIRCRFYHLEDRNHNTCDAFRDGIPVEIMSRLIDHTTPYPGDNGIRFAPVDEQDGRADA